MSEVELTEEGVTITAFGSKISKNLKVFYNPVMKLHRDISLLVLKTYFDKKILFCDPMVASGIRELRYLKSIPEIFDKLVLGDISREAIKNCKKNFRKNKISKRKVKFLNRNAIETISFQYFHCIEVDPFGSPVPFLDIALQRIKHEGMLCVTATDTAALCGTYPKKSFRRYGIKTKLTLWYDEFGLRNLIAYSQRQAAKYDLNLIPIISYSQDHYYRIFFRVDQSRTRALGAVKDLRYVEYDKKVQDVKLCEFEKKESLGKTYVGPLCDKKFIERVSSNLDLLENKKIAEKLLNKLLEELDIVGYYNTHKLQKEHKIGSELKFEEIIERLERKGFEVSRVHNNKLGIKTNAKSRDILRVLK